MELDGDDRAKLDMLESYMASVGGEAAAGGEAGEASPARRMLRRPLARSRPRGHPLVGPEACLFAGAALWARGESPQRLHAEERLRWRSSAGPELAISPHCLCDRAGAHADQGGGRGQIHAGPCGGRPGAEASGRRSRGSRGRAERTDLSRTGERSVAQRAVVGTAWTAEGCPDFSRVTLRRGPSHSFRRADLACAVVGGGA